MSAWTVTGTIPGTPAAMGSKRLGQNRATGRAILLDANDKKLRPWQANVREAFRAVAPPRPVQGAVSVRLTVRLKRPQGHYNARGDLHPWAPYFCVTKPDADKILRGVLDPGTGILWRDDSQVVEPHVLKVYTEGEPCVEFWVTEIEATEAERKDAAAAERARQREAARATRGKAGGR